MNKDNDKLRELLSGNMSEVSGLISLVLLTYQQNNVIAVRIMLKNNYIVDLLDSRTLSEMLKMNNDELFKIVIEQKAIMIEHTYVFETYIKACSNGIIADVEALIMGNMISDHDELRSGIEAALKYEHYSVANLSSKHI